MENDDRRRRTHEMGNMGSSTSSGGTPGKRPRTAAVTPAASLVQSEAVGHQAPEAESEDKEKEPQQKILSTDTNQTQEAKNQTPPPPQHHKKPAAHPAKPLPRVDLGKKKTSGGEGVAAGATAGATAAGKVDPQKNTSGIEVSVTHTAIGNPSSARTTVGVGEEVTLRESSEGEWSAGGTAIAGSSSDSATWTAPDKAGPVVIQKTVKGGPPKKLTMNVVAPSGINFVSRGAAPVAPAGVGMTTNVQILPNVVSFGACEWLEQPGGADGVSGYFAAYTAQGLGDLAHKPNPEWKSMGENNQAIDDRAWTSDKPPLTHEDGTQRYWAGGFSWAIPNKYRVKGGGETVFTTVTQAFSMDDKGTTTVTKGAASATARADGVVETDMEKAKNVGEAHAMLNRLGPNRRAMLMYVVQYKTSQKADPDTLKYLIEALTAENLELYVSISCTNTHAWVERDEVKLATIGGKGTKNAEFLASSQSDKNKGGHEFKYNLGELITYGTTDGITFNIGVEGKYTYTAPMPYPYEKMSGQELGGSGGRYWITAHIN
jgi:hypothetical protein